MIISGSTIEKDLEKKFIKKIGEVMKLSKSLFLWADNTPYTKHANLILKKYFGNMKLEGDYFGG